MTGTARKLGSKRVPMRRNGFMTTRTSQTVFRFEAGSRLAWRRVGAFIHLPAIGINGATQQMVPVDPAALEAMQHKDQQP
jgi:hypothetical protein